MSNFIRNLIGVLIVGFGLGAILATWQYLFGK